MTHPTVVVLGSTGMVGSMLVRVLAEELGPGSVTATHRPGRPPSPHAGTSRSFDAIADNPSALFGMAGSATWVVNAIGQVRPRIDEASSVSRRAAIEINSLFPHRLAEAAENAGARVLMISTDAVFSGQAGPYVESSPADPVDLYGFTKYIGEVVSPHVMHLRTSIVGPELGSRHSLLGWMLGQPDGATVPGFVNHQWNGVTTLHLAKLIAGIVRTGEFHPRACHTVPSDSVSKFDLLTLIGEAFDVHVTVAPQRAAIDVDRRLHTDDDPGNVRRWSAAGHEEVPTVRTMVAELAAYVGATGLVATDSTNQRRL